MSHTEERADGAGVDAGALAGNFATLSGLLASVFVRRETRGNAMAYIRGLLQPRVPGNCWALSEAVGFERPYRFQRLLGRGVWDEDAVRDRVRRFVAEQLGPGGVLIFDETGDLKKGTATAGVGRQYTGTAGRVENAVVAVYASYATSSGHALIDRELYVRARWFADRERLARAGFPSGHLFATKPQLALGQAARALDAGLDPAWATGDEVYGRSGELRALFEQRGIGYVFAVGCDQFVATSGFERLRVDVATRLVGPAGWNRCSCGNGAKGRRLYDWAWVALDDPRHHLLIRRSISDPAEIACYLAYVPDDYACSLTDLVRVAGARWAVEDDFQDSKQAVALDGTQVRTYRAWKRHATLVIAAYALLAVTAAQARASHPAQVVPHDIEQSPPTDCGMVALTVPELQRLVPLLLPGRIGQAPNGCFHLSWSEWRRRHQARARWHHYRAHLARFA